MKNMKKYYYSIDGGVTWEGPFTETEINDFRAIGVLDAQSLIREEPAVCPAQSYAQSSFNASAANGYEESYVVMVNGIPQVPYTATVIHQMLQAGSIKLSDMVWKEGMSSWKPMSSVLPTSAWSDVLPSLNAFSFKYFFSEVFKPHTVDEIHDCFLAGTRQGTPMLSCVDAIFPTPWIFARVFLFCLIVCIGFHWGLAEFGNPRLVPGYMFVGNFAIPFCIFLLFFELNIRRDVSFYSCMKALVGGGLLSLILTMMIYSHTKTSSPGWAGPVEETAKLMAVLLIAGKMRNGRILTGLLLGAAVGTGFAAFESAGYTLEVYAESFKHKGFGEAMEAVKITEAAVNAYNFSDMLDFKGQMLNRAWGAPLCHIVWTAITAGAYWRVLNAHIMDGKHDKNSSAINFSILTDIRFLSIAIIPVILHVLWNTLAADFGVMGYLVLGGIGWVVVFRLVGAGISQVAYEKSQLMKNL
jgi:RsiW-degrading membrane proteinase PrsW (M82 family)